MDTRTDRRLSRTQAEPLQPAGRPWFSLLTELTLELPLGVARSAATLASRGWRPQRRDGIPLSSMSDEWLREFAAEDGKREEH